MKDDIIYTEASVFDITKIAELWGKEMSEIEIEGRYADNCEKKKFLGSVYNKLTANKNVSVVLVAKEADNIIGYIIGYVYIPESGTSELIGFCDHWYVEKEYRNQKIGEGLMVRLMERAKMLGVQRIEFIAPYQKKYLRFYTSKGFVPSQVVFTMKV